MTNLKQNLIDSIAQADESARDVAPDLLEALVEMMSDFGSFRTYEGEKPKCIRLAEEAIAKARNNAPTRV